MKVFSKADLTPTENAAIDILLEEIAGLNARIGIDSIDFERTEINIKIRLLQEKIKIISEDFYNLIVI